MHCTYSTAPIGSARLRYETQLDIPLLLNHMQFGTQDARARAKAAQTSGVRTSPCTHLLTPRLVFVVCFSRTLQQHPPYSLCNCFPYQRCPWPLTYRTRRVAVPLERPHKRSYGGCVHCLNMSYIKSPSSFNYASFSIPSSLLNPLTCSISLSASIYSANIMYVPIARSERFGPC